MSLNTITLNPSNSMYTINTTSALNTTDGYIIPTNINSIFINHVLNMSTIRALVADQNIRDELNFNTIVRTQKLSFDFIKEHYDKFDHKLLYQNQSLPLSFIEESIKQLDLNNNENELNAIAENQSLTIDFIKKYLKKLNFYALFKNNNLSFESKFIKKNLKKFTDKDFYNLIYISNIQEIIDEIIDSLQIDMLNKLEWSFISWNLELSEKSIAKCLDYIDFRSPLLSERTFDDDTITCYRLLKYSL